MRDHRGDFSIQKMAELLKVSHSGYYRFLKSPKKSVDETLLKQIETIFQKNKGRYGAPRIYVELQKQRSIVVGIKSKN